MALASELWDIDALRSVPAAGWGDEQDGVRPVYYANEPYRGKPTRVFAYVGLPAKTPAPGMVLIHGGGGRAFAEWVLLWTARGYAAISMDLSGRSVDAARMEDGGPEQGDREKFLDMDLGLRNMWTYHAAAAAIRGGSLLSSLPEVDASRIGVTGISWGGYLTCVVAGLDSRFRFAVPVYGCGFIHQNSCWLPTFAQMTPDHRVEWVRHFEPSVHLTQAKMSMLWVNGTNDFAYPMDSFQRSYRAAPGARTLCIKVRMPHGHEPGWAPTEIGLYADSILTGGEPFPTMGKTRIDGRVVSADVSSRRPLVDVAMHYTTDREAWQERMWYSVPARRDGSRVVAELPVRRPSAAYLTVTDDRDVTVSSEHVVM
ncbi:acetylxylan esterase [Candidatus Poribacteria bacterium]|nr:acetylxylan esterase [Candidatus Poribacteria bacterium]